MKKLKLIVLILLLSLIGQMKAETTLATWDFESGYDQITEGKVITYVPNAVDWKAIAPIWFNNYQPSIQPNVYVGNQADYTLTCFAKSRYCDFRQLSATSHVLSLENKKSGSENALKSSTDFSSGLNAYFEAKFPTRKYYKIGVTLALSCYDGVTDIEVVYSVDNGKSWNDAGTYTSSSNFYVPNVAKITLPDADDKDSVTVRVLPGNGLKTYWYLDKLDITAETEPVQKHTVTYFDTKGKEIGTQPVFDNSTVGRFFFNVDNANMDEGYTFRGWYSSSIGGTHHYKEDLITSDTAYYAYQTKTETNDIGTSWNYKLEKENQDYDNLHDNFRLIDGVWGNMHGPYSQQLILNVAPEAEISIGTCMYSASVNGVAEFTITDPEGTVVGKMSSKAPKGEDGKIETFNYSGKPGLITLTCSASNAYYHSIGINNAKSVKVNVDATGYASYFSGAPLIVPEGVNIGVVTAIGEGTVTVDYSVYKPGDIIKALTPFILKGTPGDVELQLSSDEGFMPANNMLRGILYSKIAGTGGSYFYQLGEHEGKPVFSLAASNGRSYIPSPHTAYLATSGAISETDAQLVEVGLGDTGISSLVEAPAVKNIMYNTNGQRVGNDYKGIVIMNGRKFIK